VTQLLYLHGVGLDHTMWDAVSARVGGDSLAPDLLGHGTERQIAETSLAELAASALAGAGDSLDLVGFSLGALVAQRIAIDSPERVRSLTLVSSVANRSAAERASVEERLATAERDLREAARASVDRWFSDSFRAREPSLLPAIHRMVAGMDHGSFLAAYRVFAEGDRELWSELGAIRCPTLVITGAEDLGSTPAMARALAARIPHARAQIVPHCRHLLPYERPAELAVAIADLTARA
jgi:(E)-2-((N-methylformamido)methylene)succinate hydrolase